MLDPTWCSYLKDARGNILDIVELRGLLADGKDVFLNDEFSYNGEMLTANDEVIGSYKRYLTKDLFYFSTSEISGFRRENSGRDLFICPAGFSPIERFMYMLEYEIEFFRTDKSLSEESRAEFVESRIKFLTEQLEETRRIAEEHGDAAEETMGIVYLSLEDFLAKPDLGNE
jgi:hypothetical protein